MFAPAVVADPLPRRLLHVTGTVRPGRRLACVAVLAALPLSACAAGYQAETSRERTTLTSVGAAKGALTLRNMYFLGPGTTGHALSLHLAIFNGSGTPEKLTGLSSSVASGGSVPSDATITAGQPLYYNLGATTLPVLTGLKQNVLVGQTVTVTLTFAQAGELTVAVPVQAASSVTDATSSP